MQKNEKKKKKKNGKIITTNLFSNFFSFSL